MTKPIRTSTWIICAIVLAGLLTVAGCGTGFILAIHNTSHGINRSAMEPEWAQGDPWPGDLRFWVFAVSPSGNPHLIDLHDLASEEYSDFQLVPDDNSLSALRRRHSVFQDERTKITWQSEYSVPPNAIDRHPGYRSVVFTEASDGTSASITLTPYQDSFFGFRYIQYRVQDGDVTPISATNLFQHNEFIGFDLVGYSIYGLAFGAIAGGALVFLVLLHLFVREFIR